MLPARRMTILRTPSGFTNGGSATPNNKQSQNSNIEDDNTSTFSKVSKSVKTMKMRDGKKKINQYIVMREIGKGTFGKVKLVYNTEENNKPYAMKTVKKRRKFSGFNKGAPQSSTSTVDEVMSEIAIMKKLVRS